MSDESRQFHKPVRRPAELFDRRFAAEDPAEVSRVAHSTAHALLARVRADPDGEVVDRLVAFTDEHGIDDLAELWSRSPSRSLPGVLWRLYLLQLMIHDDAQTAALLYERGRVRALVGGRGRRRRAEPGRTGRTGRAHRHDPARPVRGRLRGRTRARRGVLPSAGRGRQSPGGRLRAHRAGAGVDAHRPRAAARGLRQRHHGLRRAVAARLADLSRRPGRRDGAGRRSGRVERRADGSAGRAMRPQTRGSVARQRVPGRRTPLGAWPLAAAEDGARGYCGPAEPV